MTIYLLESIWNCNDIVKSVEDYTTDPDKSHV